MKVAIFGAGGIVGQTMRLCVPSGVTARFYRRATDNLHCGVDLEDRTQLSAALTGFSPNAIVNLAGENRPDVVAKHLSGKDGARWYDSRIYDLNVFLAVLLARYCDRVGAHYVHASTQAVFSGDAGSYRPEDPTGPVNAYGFQKEAAERWVEKFRNWTIARLTFVLGIRPLQSTGRRNPLEDMLTSPDQRQVNDRWFSPLFARDAAAILWELVQVPPQHRIVHLGTPVRVSRYDVAKAAVEMAGLPHTVTAVSNDTFPGIATRPVDTSWAAGSLFRQSFEAGLAAAVKEWRGMKDLDLPARARELAFFLGLAEAEAVEKLSQGFWPFHAAVAEDFRRVNPQTDAELAEWYRGTDAYLWELSAYHLAEGFNYAGMCMGFATHLRNRGARRVLCLGDGIGDLTLTLAEAGLDPVYNDLANSRTAMFALFRLKERLGRSPESRLTTGWDPDLGDEFSYDAVVAMDFLEHVPNVEAWTREIYRVLRPGGLFLAQNAFGLGSGPEGSIPMHLKINDRFEKDWDPLLDAIGFVRDVDEAGTHTGWRKKL